MNDTPKSSAPERLTNYKHVNLFLSELHTNHGPVPWIFASRKNAPGASLDTPDAAVIIAVMTDRGEPRLVVIREYRAPLRHYEISAPSGLVDAGETIIAAAKRELREETGLELIRVAHVSPPLPSSAGLTDETVSLVYVEASGAVSRAHQTEHEDIEVILLSLDDVRQLLSRPSGALISSRLYPVLLGYVSAGVISLPSEISQKQSQP